MTAYKNSEFLTNKIISFHKNKNKLMSDFKKRK
jgi:hypothetical protein